MFTMRLSRAKRLLPERGWGGALLLLAPPTMAYHQALKDRFIKGYLLTQENAHTLLFLMMYRSIQ